MPITVIVHIANESPIVGELDELPNPTDQIIVLKNPRQRDGKDVTYLQDGVTTVIWSLSRISFIEVMPVEGEEEIIGFVRE
ncbi:MAG TPA: hypothetical protein ENJ02_02170 [Chloroflexi bacterium]|nr:hypothetical protein [Chloroflexota bacterium]